MCNQLWHYIFFPLVSSRISEHHGLSFFFCGTNSHKRNSQTVYISYRTVIVYLIN